MSRALVHRLVVVALTAGVLAGVAAWGGLLERRPSPPPTVREPGVYTVDEQTARRLLPRLRNNDKIEYDPVAIVRPTAGYSLPFEWPEHPAGRFVMATNGSGHREDGETAPAFDGVRIVVAGDSHPFGLLDNADSFANRLEAALDGRDGARVDVVNASVSGTGPYEYLGNVRKQLALAPDLVVCCLFTGNDFKNALLFDDWFAGRPPTGGDDERPDLGAVPEAWYGPIAQGFTQAHELSRDGEAAERALAAAVARFLDIAALCERAGAAFLTVVVPTKADVDGAHDAATIDGILSALGMTRDDYAVNRRLGERFAAALRERGVEVLDLHEPLERAEEPLYWSKDHHLGLAGHALVAELLEEPVLALLASR